MVIEPSWNIPVKFGDQDIYGSIPIFLNDRFESIKMTFNTLTADLSKEGALLFSECPSQEAESLLDITNTSFLFGEFKTSFR